MPDDVPSGVEGRACVSQLTVAASRTLCISRQFFAGAKAKGAAGKSRGVPDANECPGPNPMAPPR